MPMSAWERVKSRRAPPTLPAFRLTWATSMSDKAGLLGVDRYGGGSGASRSKAR
jgi:hypothetical protein